VQALLDAGADLLAALRDAPKKDAGFSALTLAWVLRSFEVRPLARALGWSYEVIAGAEAFRHHFDRPADTNCPPRVAQSNIRSVPRAGRVALPW
jgi:hypothetical protein